MVAAFTVVTMVIMFNLVNMLTDFIIITLVAMVNSFTVVTLVTMVNGFTVVTLFSIINDVTIICYSIYLGNQDYQCLSGGCNYFFAMFNLVTECTIDFICYHVYTC